MGLLLWAAIGAAALWYFASHPQELAREFAALIGERSGRHDRSFFHGFSHQLAGTYRGRAATVRLQRSRKQQRGFVEVGIAAATSFKGSIKRETGWTELGKRLDLVYDERLGNEELDREFVLASDNSRAFSAWMTDANVIRSIRALVLDYDLSLAVQPGRITATWSAPALGNLPRSFDREKWEAVLTHLEALARAFDRTPGGSAATDPLKGTT